MNTHMTKKDCRGRTWRSADVRQGLIGEFELAGMSAADFCSAKNINLQTFYGWLKRARNKHSANVVLREIEISLPVTSACEVKVFLPNRVEVVVPVDSPSALAFVLREAARC